MTSEQEIAKAKKTRNYLIGIVMALFLLLSFTGYHTLTDGSKIRGLEDDILKNEVLIGEYKSQLELQGKITDSLKKVAAVMDSIVLVKEKQLADITIKYNFVKNKIKQLSKEAAVSYLSTRLKQLDPATSIIYPSLIAYDGKPLVLIDTAQTQLLNLTFVSLDEKTEQLDTAKKVISLQDTQIGALKDVVGSQDQEISKCNQIVTAQDKVIADQKTLVDEKDKQLEKSEKKRKFQSTMIKVLGGAAAVLGVVVVLGM